ncbi:molecular chaperone [Pseudoroseomonas globiformis]|uniref:Molecular chaperone n=1 Tax=Teichococcus globiformis TaxID=2307229 RepID=A0ABV7FXY4_9PROT
MLTRKRLLATLCALALAGLSGHPASAGSLEVSPVSTDMAPGQQSSIVTVTNREPHPTSVQVRAFAWSQDRRHDTLTPTQDLLVSPPVFQLAPGASQVVRLVLRRTPNDAERAFRLLVDEIPGPAQEGQQVRFALRLSLPVFAHSTNTGRAELDWRIMPDGVLSVTNRGTRRAQLAGLTLAGPGGARMALAEPENPYVLPGVDRHWQLRGAVPRPGSVLRASGVGEAGQFAVDIPVAASR